MNSREEAALKLQDVIGYRFNDEKLLIEALSHTSYTNERRLGKINSYQRLEFLGDAVLELFTSRYLFELHPDFDEGELTKIRASMVCEEALAGCARKIELKKYILLGVGEKNNHGEEKSSILSDVFEAVIGAVFVDGGYEKAGKHIERFVFDAGVQSVQDVKTRLQETVQGRWHSNCDIVYEVLDSEGPDHNKEFEIRVLIKGEEYGRGKGNSKKEAQTKAAAIALEKLKL